MAGHSRNQLLKVIRFSRYKVNAFLNRILRRLVGCLVRGHFPQLSHLHLYASLILFLAGGVFLAFAADRKARNEL